MSRLRPFFILPVFAAFTLPLMPLQQLFVWFWPAMARRFPMHYHRAVLRILGVRLKVLGEPLLQGPALIAANHAGWLDIVILSAVAPVSFIAKREVNGWPFFGSLARLQRTVFIDRERRHTTGSGRDEIQERLKAGDILVLFAEGTSSDGARVLPFKSAFFGAAELPEVSVQPVTIAYDGHRNMPMNRQAQASLCLVWRHGIAAASVGSAGGGAHRGDGRLPSAAGARRRPQGIGPAGGSPGARGPGARASRRPGNGLAEQP